MIRQVARCATAACSSTCPGCATSRPTGARIATLGCGAKAADVMTAAAPYELSAVTGTVATSVWPGSPSAAAMAHSWDGGWRISAARASGARPRKARELHACNSQRRQWHRSGHGALARSPAMSGELSGHVAECTDRSTMQLWFGTTAEWRGLARGR
jgi:hypothetical protein